MFFQNNFVKTLNNQMLAWLFILPFAVTAFERLILKPLVTAFPLDATSTYLLKMVIVSLLLFSIAAFFGKTYGLEITKKLRKFLSLLFLSLIMISYLFLFSLKVKHFFDMLAVIHLVNWILSVFREEFILRGVIQTEAYSVLKGRFWGISHSIWFTTLVFSLWHLVNLAYWPWQVVTLQMISSIPSGIVLGLIREKTGNTLLTYLLHICGDLLFFSLYTLIFSKLFFSLY